MAAFDFKKWSVSRSEKAPLLDFIVQGLRAAGCSILYASAPTRAPFLISYETPLGERQGVLAYAFFANSRETKNRPKDEHRFQVKYGGNLSLDLPVEFDPAGLVTTIFVGIDTEHLVAVSADPLLHDMRPMSLSVEFKKHHVGQILRDGWHAWERASHGSHGIPVEALVGVKQDKVLDLIQFERLAFGLDTGNRQLLAEKVLSDVALAAPHALVTELNLSEHALFDLINGTKRLKMAVRGWVAEVHLEEYLKTIPDVHDCYRINEEGSPDISLRYKGSAPILVECKNVLRIPAADGSPKLDFQRTRASKGDPCSRYYRHSDFAILAACLHAVTQKWDFNFIPTKDLLPHKTCVDHLSNNVQVKHWYADPAAALAAA